MGKITFKSWGAVVLLVSSSVSYAGWADELSKGLGVLNSVLGAASSKPTSTTSMGSSTQISDESSIARPTDEQINKIARNLQVKTNDAALDKAIGEAKNNIAKVLLAASCQVKGFNLAAGDAMSADHSSTHSIIPFEPSSMMSRTECLDVSNVSGWKLFNPKQLEFKVIYSSPTYGTPATRKIVMKNDYGQWLLYSHDHG